MKIPFTQGQFLEVFKNYNNAVFPAQVLFYLIAVLVIYLIIKKPRTSGKVITYCLAFFWLWMGIVYHLIFFTTINKAAYLFGVLFILEAIFLLTYSYKLTYTFSFNVRSSISALLIFYALIAYPVIGIFLDHAYPYAPTFGLPCPTTIFTFGILLLAENKVTRILLVIPLLWSLVGTSAALNLDFYEDYGMLVAGVISAAFIFRSPKFRLSEYR